MLPEVRGTGQQLTRKQTLLWPVPRTWIVRSVTFSFDCRSRCAALAGS